MKVIKKSFGIILTLSLICLILLVTGVIMLTNKDKTTFSNNGYIITYQSGNTNVHNFDAETEYKYNLNGDLVFKDVNDEKQTATLDNFIHYSNGDISFLQNGVIMDLKGIDETIIPYYNITPKSLIKYENESYTIANGETNLSLNSWIGKISDNKYIVGGSNVSARIAGTSDVVYATSAGSFFEITYIEDGVVIISDGVTTRSTTADGSYIYLDNDIVISLGDMYIYHNNEAKVSLNQMTINGDENIDIIPPEEPEDDNGSGDGDGDGTTTNPDDGQGGTGTGEDPSDTPTEPDEPDEETPPVTITKNPTFRVIEANVTANMIDLVIEVTDEYNVISGALDINVVDITTGETAYQTTIEEVGNMIEFSTGSGTLAPNTSYIVSITGGYTTEELEYEKQYFQRLFVTEGLGIELEKSFATKNSLAFDVTIGNSEAVKGFDLTLYDMESNQIATKTLLTTDNLSDILFEELNSNTEYKIVLNNIVYNNVTYVDINDDINTYRENGDYTISLNVKTLKQAPIVKDLEAIVNEEKTKVNFNIKTVEDSDNAIVSYNYYVYKYNSVTSEGGTDPVMEAIVKKDSTPFDVDIDGVNLVTGQSYRYMVVVEYYDNEKYVEYETGYSNSFVAGAMPSVSYTIDNDNTTFNTLSGTITIADENCTVPVDGRGCYNQPNEIFIRYYKAGTTIIDYHTVSANFDPNTLSYKFTATGLEADSTYVIEVFGGVDFKDGNGLNVCTSSIYNDTGCVQIGESMYASTKKIVPITVNWGNEKISVESQVFSLGGNIITSLEDSIAELEALASLKINVYASSTTNIEDGVLVGEVTKTSNLKNEFVDNNFTISATGTFGFDIDTLKRKTNGILTKYYIFEITDVYDAAGVNNINITNNTYAFEISTDLRADDILSDPEIAVRIVNSNNLAYKAVVTAMYDYENLALLYPNANYNIVMGVCNKATSECHDLSPVNINDNNGSYSYEFLYNRGTDYYASDTLWDDNQIKLYRGDSYVFRYYITVDEEKDGTIDYYYPGRIDKEYVESAPINEKKQDVEFRLSVVSSTENSITYKFWIFDFDRALYKEEGEDLYNIYYEVDGSSYKVPVTANQTNIEFTIPLSGNNSKYKIFYETAPVKTGNITSDKIIAYEKEFTFDGFYQGDDYGLEYTLENNPVSNKITLKILDTEQSRAFLERVSLYQIVINLDSQVFRTRYYNELKDCTDGSCLKYLDFNYSIIEDVAGRNLSVDFYAYYDSGLIFNESEYGYLIQENSNSEGQGKYLLLDTSNNIITSTLPKDLYYYTLNGTTFSLYNLINNNFLVNNYQDAFYKRTNITLTETSEGLKYGNYSVTVKTVDRTKINNDGDNSFIFYSITPDISTSYDPIINGADIHIDGTSITQNVLVSNFIADTDSKYYYYVELYDSDGALLETKKVEIKTQGITDVTFDNLNDNEAYTYKIFAYLDKNGSVYTQLNDTNECDKGTCLPVEYTFTTLDGSLLYGDMQISHEASSTDEKYLNRELSINITMNPEIINNLRNYDLIINLIDGEDIVATNTIANADLEATMEQVFDITEEDPIFGDKYYIVELLAKTNTENGEENVTIYHDYITLRELNTPAITVSKGAHTEVIDDRYIYSLEYDINIIDNDKVIPNGYYTVRLIDPYSEEVAKIENIPVSELRHIVFSNELSNPDKYNVIADLIPNREYTLEVSYNTYMNNKTLRDEALQNGADINTYINRLNVYNYSIYTSGVYGVSLGELSINATTNNITMSFFSSSNLTNITKMEYTIIREGSSETLITGSYTIGEGLEKTFNAIEGSNGQKYYTLIIDPEGLSLQSKATYIITFQFYITDSNGEYQAISTSNNSRYITVA